MTDPKTYTEIGLKRVKRLFEEDSAAPRRMLAAYDIHSIEDAAVFNLFDCGIEFGVIGYLLKHHDYDVFAGHQYPLPVRILSTTSEGGPKMPDKYSEHLARIKEDVLGSSKGLKSVTLNITPEFPYDKKNTEYPNQLFRLDKTRYYIPSMVALVLNSYIQPNDTSSIIAVSLTNLRKFEVAKDIVGKYPSLCYQSPSEIMNIPFAPNIYYNQLQTRDMTILSARFDKLHVTQTASDYLQEMKTSLQQTCDSIPVDRIKEYESSGTDISLYTKAFIKATTTAFNILTHNIAAIAEITINDPVAPNVFADGFTTAMSNRNLVQLFIQSIHKPLASAIRLQRTNVDLTGAKLHYNGSAPPNDHIAEWTAFLEAYYHEFHKEPAKERTIQYFTMLEDVGHKQLPVTLFNTYDLVMQTDAKRNHLALTKPTEIKYGNNSYKVSNLWMCNLFCIINSKPIPQILTDITKQLIAFKEQASLIGKGIILYFHNSLFNPFTFSAGYRLANPYIKFILYNYEAFRDIAGPSLRDRSMFANLLLTLSVKCPTQVINVTESYIGFTVDKKVAETGSGKSKISYHNIWPYPTADWPAEYLPADEAFHWDALSRGMAATPIELEEIDQTTIQNILSSYHNYKHTAQLKIHSAIISAMQDVETKPADVLDITSDDVIEQNIAQMAEETFLEKFDMSEEAIHALNDPKKVDLPLNNDGFGDFGSLGASDDNVISFDS